MNFWDYDSFESDWGAATSGNYMPSEVAGPQWDSFESDWGAATSGANYMPTETFRGSGVSTYNPDAVGLPSYTPYSVQGGFTPSKYALTTPTMGSGTSVGAAPGGLNVRAGQGTFSAGTGLRASAFPTATAAPAGGNSGITGAFGGVGNALDRFEQWGKNNPRTAALLNYGVGALAERAGQKRASRAMDRQNALQEQAMASQRQAVEQNNQQAGFWNQQAQQSANEARSLYNPQELGIRGMAQQVAATGRREQETRQAAMKRGMSAADAEAEARRVRLAGSTAATTGYMAGLDTGRQAQGSALSGAKGLSSPYQGLGAYAPNAAEANFLAQQGGAQGAQLQQLLEFYTGDPSRRILREREKGEQKEST
jgi:hypothetical protein